MFGTPSFYNIYKQGHNLKLIWTGAKDLLTCKCIHEGGQWSVEHVEEWIPTGKSMGSTQDCVLQNVWHSSAVHGSGTETHTG